MAAMAAARSMTINTGEAAGTAVPIIATGGAIIGNSGGAMAAGTIAPMPTIISTAAMSAASAGTSGGSGMNITAGMGIETCASQSGLLLRAATPLK